MKKCTSCAKDLPDAALHCVFCGTKQPPVPAGAQAKTVMGWQASDLLKDINKPKAPAAGPPPAAPPPAAGPPPAAPPYSPPPSGVAATIPAGVGMMPPTGGPQQAPSASAATVFAAPAPSMGGPAGGPPPPMGPGPMGGYAGGPPPPMGQPSANAATMFAPGQGPPGPMGPPMGGPPMGPPMGGPPGPMGPPGPHGMGGPPPPMGPPMGGPPMGPPMGGPPHMGPGPMGPPMGGPPHMGPGPMGPPMGPPHMGPPHMGPGPMGPPHMGPGPMGPPHMGPGPMGPPMGQPGMPYGMQPQHGQPPYLASRTAQRVGAPFEPFKDQIRTVLMVFGALLLAAFVVPMGVEPETVFTWDVLSAEGVPAMAKFSFVYLAAAGVLALVFATVPLATVPRGALAAVLGLVPLVLGLVMHIKDAPEFRWQEIVQLIGALTLVPGLLLRGEYRSHPLPRILATVGALCILLPLLVPEGGGDPPIAMMFKAIGEAPGKAKVIVIVSLLPVVIAVMALLVWIPAPSNAAAPVTAWLAILQAVIIGYVSMLVAGHLGDALKAKLGELLLSGWVAGAFIAFLGYGIATLLGKNLEQQP